MKELRLTYKVPAIFAGVAIVMALGVGISSYVTSLSSIPELTDQRLNGAAKSGKTKIVDYFESIEHELELVSSMPFTAEAIETFSNAWSEMAAVGLDPETELQKTYITQNPHPNGEKFLLVQGPEKTSYDRLHARYHPWYTKLQQDQGYYDIFLFDAQGNLVYSVFKELDYATNFRDGGGEWASTDLGVVYRQALNAPKDASIAFEDFAPYAPSYGAPASFMAHPVRNDMGETIGVLAFQMPVDGINGLLAEDVGLGETGELVFLGEDGFMRNDSRTTADKDDILATRLESPVLDEAWAKDIAFGEDTVLRNEPMEIVARSLEYRGNKFLMAAVQTRAEAFQPVTQMRNRMLLVGGLLLGGILLVGLVASRSIVGPINRVVVAMTDLASGNLEIDLSGAKRRDEIGEMFRAVETFRKSAKERGSLEREATREREREKLRQAHMDSVIESFKQVMQSSLQMLSDQMGIMSRSSDNLEEVASKAADETEGATKYSFAASEHVATVAAATEEMTATIEEIASQTNTTGEIVLQAVTTAERSNQKVAELSAAAEHIGSVVNLIRDIAEQTNLLALNATIEAARAGEAGKGFAVVASEVKQLAEQTSKATDEISAQISGIQSAVAEAASSIDEIGSKVKEVKELTSSVASAVEEQNASTGEIAASSRSASDSTRGASDQMANVSAAIKQTSVEAVSFNSAAGMVAHASQNLTKEVEKFLEDVVKDVEERRRSLRVAVSKSVQAATQDGQWVSVRMIDISTSGAHIEGTLDLPVGGTLQLALDDGQVVKATVVRYSDEGIGVAFDQNLPEIAEELAA